MRAYIAITLGLLVVAMILEAVYGQRGCACAMMYQPVCGSDGKNYGNACALSCAVPSNPGNLIRLIVVVVFKIISFSISRPSCHAYWRVLKLS
jgi:hypothetical protein